MTSLLPHDLIVSEILVRLPAKSLLRLSCVCKAWRTTISDDPSFSQAHLHRLHQQNKKPCSLLITPRITVEAAEPWSWTISHEVSAPGLYLWEESKPDVAALLHDTSSFPAEDKWARHRFAHCDGLVMLPAEDTVRVLNPATRQAVVLPWSPNIVTSGRRWGTEGHKAFGFERDHGTNAYKVARFFYRECLAEDALGMEVFTIRKDDCWRETVTRLPFCFVAMQTATFFKGSLIWTVDHESLMYEDLSPDEIADMPCFVRFSLEDESFNIIIGPPWYRGPNKFKPGVVVLTLTVM
ncbi:F-box protein At1g52495-like [Triticum urartu]|uniref:F-box protein At1g52495-like n=1 Tax=Triticum urartu TaxID=4572 RepID=UPI002042C6E5|nr:F-box protein At1g52495-like [Triticum urartu]